MFNPGLIPEIWWPPVPVPPVPWTDPGWSDERLYELPKIEPRYDPDLALATAFVQKKTAQATTATSVAATMDAALTVGNFVVVGVSNGTASDFNHPNDDASGGSNLYQELGAKLAVRVPNLQMYYAVPNHAAGTVVTATTTVSGTLDLVVMEFSGSFTSTVSPFVKVNTGTTATGQSTDGSLHIAYTCPSSTLGNLLTCYITNQDGRTVTSITDNTGNTWSKLKEGSGACIMGTMDTHGAVTTLTLTLSGASTSACIDFAEHSGARYAGVNTPVVNHSGTATATGTAIALSTAIGTQVGNLVLACINPGGNRGRTEGAGYTKITSQAAANSIAILSQYKLSAAATTETAPATLDGSATWGIVAVEILPQNAPLLSGKAGAGSATTGTALTSNLVGLTPTAGSLMVVFATANAAEAFTAGTGYDGVADGTNAGGEYRLSCPGSAETTPFTMDVSAQWQLEAFEILVGASASAYIPRGGIGFWSGFGGG